MTTRTFYIHFAILFVESITLLLRFLSTHTGGETGKNEYLVNEICLFGLILVGRERFVFPRETALHSWSRLQECVFL